MADHHKTQNSVTELALSRQNVHAGRHHFEADDVVQSLAATFDLVSQFAVLPRAMCNYVCTCPVEQFHQLITDSIGIVSIGIAVDEKHSFVQMFPDF